MSGMEFGVTPSTLLGVETSRRLAAAIPDAMRAAVAAGPGAVRLVGVWDAATRFAAVVEVLAEGPVQWHLRGPLLEDQAQAWLGMVGEGVTHELAARH